MSKLTICMAAVVLAGCASTSGWRALQIDGSSEATFRESVTRLDQELPRTFHRQMFALALTDIARAGVLGASDSEAAYTNEDFFSEVDGLTYEGVIDLANRAGPSVATQYYSRGGIGPVLGSHPLSAERRSALAGFSAEGSGGIAPRSAYRTGWPEGSVTGNKTVVTRPDRY